MLLQLWGLEIIGEKNNGTQKCFVALGLELIEQTSEQQCFCSSGANKTIKIKCKTLCSTGGKAERVYTNFE